MTVSIKFNSDQFKSGKFIVLIFLKKKVLVTPTTVFKKATFYNVLHKILQLPQIDLKLIFTLVKMQKLKFK